MSGFLFNIIIDWITKNPNNAKWGLRWKCITVLEDLDYAGDIALLSSRHKDLQEKCKRLQRKNKKAANPISINGQDVKEVNSFIYLGATVQGEGALDHMKTCGVNCCGLQERHMPPSILSGGQRCTASTPN